MIEIIQISQRLADEAKANGYFAGKLETGEIISLIKNPILGGYCNAIIWTNKGDSDLFFAAYYSSTIVEIDNDKKEFTVEVVW